MRELIIHRGPRVEFIESRIPTPGAGKITIKVHAVALNPKDWKMSEWLEGRALNEGEDIAGTVYAIGDDVFGFEVGSTVSI